MLATHTDGVLTGPQTLTLSFGEIFIGESSLVHRGRGVPPPSSVLRHMVASRSCDRLYKHLLANWPAGKHLTAALALRYARSCRRSRHRAATSALLTATGKS